MKLLRFALTAILLMGVVIVTVFGQGPSHKRINFTINVPFELKESRAVLPPGNYVLFQVSTNAPYLFALYQDDLTNEPIAMISTTRINNSVRGYPGKTRLLMDTDESWPQRYPVLEGFNIPGDDGWEVIGVVTRERGLTSSSR